jgi:hypothetical protein
VSDTNFNPKTPPQGNQWLKPYYFSRAAFSIVWVAIAFTLGKSAPAVSAALLLVYPVWDAAANWPDATRNGGLKSNPTQALNVGVSAVKAVAVVVAMALGISMNAVLVVFGIWAALAGPFQLATAVRRWRTYGAQWAMVLSGTQSALAGVVVPEVGFSNGSQVGRQEGLGHGPQHPRVRWTSWSTTLEVHAS